MHFGPTIGLLLSATVAAGSLSAQTPGLAQPVMIFFDSGKSEIRRDWAETLDAAIPSLRSQSGALVAIDGHSDRSGTSSANRLSSLRRAKVVRAYLVARGVPSDAIVVRGFGEERPLVATADGVREPQNRRVDVRVSSAPGR